uniref:Uncharacterized protein n=1 Tax=Human betaherpesvirus 6A TaxID=32603 RepID=A0A2L2Q8N2_9BETA|nr:hypothetical protein [Human betaherpesvirus 6A]AVI07891.1 hypothetical protein [Human betaherpesvirus 6A]AVI08020.1 hypothetical protein [Human betaherpesvirus 6A]AVI08146.1 hypothetical protein [Human betaherpesvirus 6A]AVI08268.1 hypothetical protein [Human betaherpesvirus 6A]
MFIKLKLNRQYLLNVFNKLRIIIFIMIQPVQRMMFIPIVRGVQMKTL